MLNYMHVQESSAAIHDQKKTAHKAQPSLFTARTLPLVDVHSLDSQQPGLLSGLVKPPRFHK